MEFHEFPDGVKLRMESGFVGDFAEHARALMGDSALPSKLIVDLSDVNYIDAVDEEFVAVVQRIGVTFTTESAYPHDVCECPRTTDRLESAVPFVWF